jgi:hypothetical protein
MADLRALWWAHVEQEARAGNLDPLAAELRRPDCGPIPDSVRALLADLAQGKRPRKGKARRIADRSGAEFEFLAHRARGAAAGTALDAVMRRWAVERATAYATVARVLPVGERLARRVQNRKA